jgi:hypothetical protein
MAFYAFSGTNLLTRCHSASSLFSVILCFWKVTQEIFSELDETKAEHPEIYPSFQKSEEETERGHGPTTQQGSPAQPLAAPPMCVTALVHFWRRPFAYKDARWEIPKYPINFPETHRDLTSSLTWDQEGLEALPGTLPERGIATGGLLHRHACLWYIEWVVYLRLWVHSSS